MKHLDVEFYEMDTVMVTITDDFGAKFSEFVELHDYETLAEAIEIVTEHWLALE